MHPLNRRTYLWLAAVFVTVVAFIALAVYADSAEAHSRYRSRGFEPSEATLECINKAEGSPAADSDDNRRYRGLYQSDRNFEVAYAVNLIPPEHWWLWGSHTWERADRWHPMIQHEMARNGVRARGLQPWPPASRFCPRR